MSFERSPVVSGARFVCALLTVSLLLGPVAAAGASRSISSTSAPSAEALVSLASPGDLALSRDGRWAAFTRSIATRDTSARPSEDDTGGGWKRDRQVVLLELATRQMRTLTSGDDAASAPRFSPDGHTLAFLRKDALWLLPLAGGEAVRLDTGKLAPSDYRFSPDGQTIALLAEPPPSDSETESRWAAGGAFDWELQWRSSRLWVIPTAGGTPRAASPDTMHVAEFEWSPDGRRFAVLAARTSDPYEVFNFTAPRVLDAADGRVVATLTRTSDSYGTAHGNLLWTSDARTVLLTGLNGGLSNVNALLAWEPTTGRVRDLAPDRDHTFDALALANGGREVLALVKTRSESKLLRFPIAGGPPRDAGLTGVVLGGGLHGDAAGLRFVALGSTPRAPAEVTLFDLASRRATALTRLHPEVAAWALGETQVVRWRCPEGVDLEGLLTSPVGGAADGPPPLVVLPHGGPDDVTQQSFSAQVQWLATHGYAVFRPNYRGGTGYGFAFYEANRGRFGTIEQMDIESGVDALIVRKLVDPQRLFFGGWSWGGYLTAWTIGHVQRYRAAVVGAGVNDVTASYSSSDINHGVAAQWEYKGDPWSQPEQFDRANPLRYARHMATPTLVLHGQSDDRVNFQNGIALHRALADVGCEVAFYAYPREPHGFTEPAHLVHRYRVWLEWYDRHGGAAVARP